MMDRTHLAAAHAELALAAERLGKIEAALTETRTGDLTTKRELAERNLADARNAAPQAWVDALVDGGPQPDHVARAERDLALAVNAEEAADASRRLLRAEEARVRDLVERCRVRLRQEAVAFIKASPEAAALVAEYDHSTSRLDAICAVVQVLPAGAIPMGNRFIRPTGADANHTLATRWAAAFSALESDPSAALPDA
jgi:hypothetical protein